MGTDGVDLLRGMPQGDTPVAKRDRERVRHREREALRDARARQDQNLSRTGFAGGNAELGHAVAFELRRLGYSPDVASYGGHLCAVGGSWNFQGQPRLAQLVGRSLRTAQRYRAQLEGDGLLRSYCLEPGDLIDGQRAPVSRPQVVRDLSALRALALKRLAQRPVQPHRRSKAQARAEARARALVAPPVPAPLSPTQLQDVAAKAPEWLRGAILQGAGVTAAVGRTRPPGATAPSAGSAPPPPPLTEAELHAVEEELRELTEQLDRERSRPPPPD